MSEPAFQRVEELFHEAVTVEPGRRAAFLDAACAGDAALRAAVQELLDHDAEGDDDSAFLASPVARPTGADGPDAGTVPAWGERAAPAPAVPGYEILGELGRGGMGVVYKARQLNLNRLVALKMLLPGAPADLEPLARFRTEAEVLTRLHHPNIVPIHDIGESEGRPYFTMEYVPGPNLARFLGGRPQEASAAARLVETLARAVHAAHRCGVLHRDLKPANILLSVSRDAQRSAPDQALPSGSRLTEAVPKITDFGLAKDQTALRTLTQTGAAMGTPCYMAPEQARGDKTGIGPATDVYALGSILYEMLTGRPPFDAPTAAETVAQVLNDDPPPPSRLRPRLPRDIVTICMKCLEKSPRRRYATALELAEDLLLFRVGKRIYGRPVGPIERAVRWCRRRPLAASLLALLGVLLTAFVVTVAVYEVRLQDALQRKLSAEEAIDAEQKWQIIQLNLTVAVTAENGGEVFTAALHYTEALRLDRDAPPDSVHWYRQHIAAALRRQPRLVGLRTLGNPIFCAGLGPAGGWAASAGDDHRIVVWDLATGRPVGPALPQKEAPLDGAFSRDGARLAVLDAGGGVCVWDVPAARLLAGPVHTGLEVRVIGFNEEGDQFVLTGADGTAERRKTQTAELIASSPGPPLGRARMQYVSPDKRLAVTTNDAGVAFIVENATGKPVAPALHPGGVVRAAAFRADGKQVVIAGGNGVVCTWELPSPDAPPDDMEDRPMEELTALAQLLSGARIDEHEEERELDAAELQAAWDRLRHEP